ncbi:F-box only protein 28 [Manduca sexta]|uniref:F-box only protein 28 n=1 Tax=Manduca sexta TaxID=7130 RepID=UPI00188F1C05|nr:F-box only protein 28 [Manduca sexta]
MDPAGLDQQTMDFLSLPVVMVENIFSYLSYDEIARNRLVSKAVNQICMRMLNRGFLMIERRHALALKNVKSQLPRRESERRYHPLSRHCDILTSIETRISMLNMTYAKFIDHGLCCFIPGKVIDEIKRVLTIVEKSTSPPRAHEVLQELRDISSMAIEHFDDKISPVFRKQLQEGAAQPVPRPSASVLAPLALRQEVVAVRRRSLLNARLSLYLATQFKLYYKRMLEYKNLAMRQQKMILHLNRKQKDQDAAIAELKKRIEECDIKYTELTHTNQAAGGKAIAATSSEVSPAPTQPLRHFSSQIKLDLSVLPIGTSKRSHSKLLPNIKPRKPLIKLPSLSEDDGEPPAKVSKTEENARPSTSGSSKNLRLPTSFRKIHGMTNQLQRLEDLAYSFEGNLKRPSGLTPEIAVPDCKKPKMD